MRMKQRGFEATKENVDNLLWMISKHYRYADDRGRVDWVRKLASDYVAFMTIDSIPRVEPVDFYAVLKREKLMYEFLNATGIGKYMDSMSVVSFTPTGIKRARTARPPKALRMYVADLRKGKMSVTGTLDTFKTIEKLARELAGAPHIPAALRRALLARLRRALAL